MNAELVTCEGCERPIFSTESSCPFCSAPTASKSKLATAGKLFMGLMTPVVLAACYGTGGFIDIDSGVDGSADQDGDGWINDADCDDTNADVNPDVPEDCTDEIDNDCDGDVDADDEDCGSTE